MNRSSRVAAALILALSLAPAAFADEAAIRKNIGERVPQFPKIDEITKSPIPGIYELRIGTDLYYSDEQGNYIIEGQLVVFADPNCGYCKKFEKDLQAVKDVTVYTFLYPILGGDSPEKSKQIWCAKDNTKAWREWMLKGTMVSDSPQCDTSALQRNYAFGQSHRIRGTPGLVFEDGRSQAGAMSTEQIEKQLAATRVKTPG